jgi:multicomponent Na+:H+ antiporter subunit E
MRQTQGKRVVHRRGGHMKRWQIKWVAIGIEFIFLFSFWVVLSGNFQVKYLVIGVFASGLVTYLTNEFIYKARSVERGSGIGYIMKRAVRLILYLPWLILAIMKANIKVASILIKPRMPIDPVLLQFETKLSKRVSLVTLANSITLTPGTITVGLEKGKYIVHSLTRECAEDLETGVMQNKVARIFDDNEDTTSPRCSWVYSLQELEQ